MIDDEEVGPDPKRWCEKGLCTRAATRIAHLRSNGVIVSEIRACDEHGGPPFEELPSSEDARWIGYR